MKKNFRSFITIIILLITTLLLIVTKYTFVPVAHKLLGSTAAEVKWKYILYWTKMFGRSDFNLGLGSEIFKACPVNNCLATDNKSYVPVDKFDAILFHGVEYFVAVHGKPKNRSPNQYYVFSSQESPVYTPQFLLVNNFFNWTMTYRLDSDIVRPYGFYQKTRTHYHKPSIEEVKRKRYKIAWMVSNCQTISLRKVLYKKLNKYIKIDVYGSCGNKTCSKQDPEKCYTFLEENYKFYLSFENSICRDYVTEKLYNILKRNLLPIVYGGADYQKIAPPNSVIDVMKFGSVKELAKYIIFLDQNPKEYLKYFEWKRNFVIETNSKKTLCSICEKLNVPIQSKTYDNVYKWWNFKQTCKSGVMLPKILYT